MNAIQLVGDIRNEDDAGIAWSRGVAAEWSDDLKDPSQDIYTLEDGRPVNKLR